MLVKEKEAKKAWLIAGFFSGPYVLGVILGMLAKVAATNGMFEGIHRWMMRNGITYFATILPIGLMGLMLSSYFSAILSTADSCLMAASGNIVTDILAKFSLKELTHKKSFNFHK
jgi:SSS family solute:Na+ symporter